MPIIIDGYNLLRCVEKLDEHGETINDVLLCRLIGKYLKLIRQKGEIVFDGIGPPDKSAFYNIAEPEVVFSGAGIEADAVIENKIKINTAPKRLTVVSSDQRIRKAARARNAISLKSEVFWGEVQKRLRTRKEVTEPTEKYQGLNESETQQWLKFFELDQ